MRLTLLLALVALGLPATAAEPSVPATAQTGPVAAAVPAAVPAAKDAVHLPPENAGEAQLRAQLEQVRALNAQLRQEREQLEAQLATIQAEVMVEDKRLKQVVSESERLRRVEADGTGMGWMLAAAAGGGFVLLCVGIWYLYRRRNAVGKA